MTKKTYKDLLDIYFIGYKWAMKKYPKAAKKKRVQNKWKKRYGNDNLSKVLQNYDDKFNIIKETK